MSPIEDYLRRLHRALPPLRRARILAEVEDHLRAAAVEHGEEEAIARFGPPERVAFGFRALRLRWIVALAAVAVLAYPVLTYPIVENSLPPAPWPEGAMPASLEWKRDAVTALFLVALGAGLAARRPGGSVRARPVRRRLARPRAPASVAHVSCCSSKGCDAFFNERFARRVARRYRKRGLDKTSQRMVDFLKERGVGGATVLEIGGGVGEIQIELLRAGAARAVNLELSPAYDEEARALAREHGVGEQVERRIHDIAEAPVEPADVVVLHRVVCCYPDYERLLGAAADHARHLLVFSYPPRNVLSRTFMTVANAMQALLRRDFRSFTHPPAAMLAVPERKGMERTFAHHGFVWQVAGLKRA